MNQNELIQFLKKEYVTGNTTFMPAKMIEDKCKAAGFDTNKNFQWKLNKLYAFGYLEVEREGIRLKYRIKPKIAKNGLDEMKNPLSANLTHHEWELLK